MSTHTDHIFVNACRRVVKAYDQYVQAKARYDTLYDEVEYGLGAVKIRYDCEEHNRVEAMEDAKEDYREAQRHLVCLSTNVAQVETVRTNDLQLRVHTDPQVSVFKSGQWVAYCGWSQEWKMWLAYNSQPPSGPFSEFGPDAAEAVLSHWGLSISDVATPNGARSILRIMTMPPHELERIAERKASQSVDDTRDGR